MGVSVREKPKASGYWWLFIRHKGQRVCQYVAQDKEIAEDAAKDIRKEIRTGRFNVEALKASRIAKEEESAKPKMPTLKEYYARFEREHLRIAVGDNTRIIYANAFNLHILPAMIPSNPDEKGSPLSTFGELHLDELTRPRVKSVVASLLNKHCSRVVKVKVTNIDGSVTTTKKTVHFKLSKATLRIVLSALTTCLTNAQREDGLIPSNPALGLGRFIAHAKKRREAVDPFRAEEVPVFLEAVRATAPDFLCMLTILIHCGLRAGECAALTWGDVDFKNKYLLIRQSWDRRGYVGKTKNKKERKVDLSDAAIASLKAHRAKLQEEFLKREAKSKEDGQEKPKEFSEYVFPYKGANPHNMSNVRNRIFYRACEKAGLHRRPLHATRHTFATLLLQQGESPVYVKEQMGHSSISVTVDIYKHWIPSANRDAVNRLPSIGGPTAMSQSSGD